MLTSKIQRFLTNNIMVHFKALENNKPNPKAVEEEKELTLTVEIETSK